MQRASAILHLCLRLRPPYSSSYLHKWYCVGFSGSTNRHNLSSCAVVSMSTSPVGKEGGDVPTETDHVEITEGRAKILFPNSNEVFYNPVQEFNRDLSIAAIKYYSEYLWNPDRFRKIRRPQWKSSTDSADEDDLTEEHLERPEQLTEEQVAAGKPRSSEQGGVWLSEPMDTCDAGSDGGGQRDVTEVGGNRGSDGGGQRDVTEVGGNRGSDGGGQRDMTEVGGNRGSDGGGQRDMTEVGGNRDSVDERLSRGDDQTNKLEESIQEEVETESGDMAEGPVAQQWKQPNVSGLRILEALAASGLRSIRYAQDIPRVHSIVANDFSPEAYQSMGRNIENNGVGEKVKPSCREASMLMYEHRDQLSDRFDVIDLDPYGSPSQFLDSTVQAVTDGGLLCITCTDTSVLCGNHPETCHSKYGSMSLKARYCHEMALRIVLASLESHANRYHRYIVPLLSCSIDFYVRVFVQVFTSPAEVKRSPSKLAMVYQCIGCESFHFQPIGKRLEEGKSRKYPTGTGPPVDRLCDQCGSMFKLGGPIWIEPIHDAVFVRGLLEEMKTSSSELYHTADRIKGLLTVVSEELHDVPLYYVLDQLCSTLHCNCPKMLAISANAVKTDAPHHVIWDIMRCWVKDNPVKNIKPNSPAAAILSKEPKIAASFAIRKDANPPSRLLKLSRFPENPRAYWGPKARAKRQGESAEDLPTKRQRLQGKRTKN